MGSGGAGLAAGAIFPIHEAVHSVAFEGAKRCLPMFKVQLIVFAEMPFFEIGTVIPRVMQMSPDGAILGAVAGECIIHAIEIVDQSAGLGINTCPHGAARRSADGPLGIGCVETHAVLGHGISTRRHRKTVVIAGQGVMTLLIGQHQYHVGGRLIMVMRPWLRSEDGRRRRVRRRWRGVARVVRSDSDQRRADSVCETGNRMAGRQR